MVLPRILWSEFEFSAEEEDGGSIVFKGSKASSIGFERLNLRVDSL